MTTSILTDMISQTNLFGLGPDPLAICLALIITFVVSYKEMEEKKYTNAGVVFLSSWAAMFSGGMAIHIELIAIASLAIGLGILVSEGVKVKFW